MSIRQVALYAGCTDSYLSLLERGERGKRRPSPEFLRKLAPVLGTPYEVLISVAGYHFFTNDQILWSGATVKFLREILGEDHATFAERTEMSLREVITLEAKGVQYETFRLILEKRVGDRRNLEQTHQDVIVRLEKAFSKLPIATSDKIMSMIHTSLDLAQE